MHLATPEQPRKVCVVVASRANYGRIKTVLEAIRDHPALELQLIVSASALLSRFGSAIDVIRGDGFEPDRCIHIIVEGENPTTMAKSTGLAVMEMATAFENLRPDIALTVADRFETMATAIAAAYMNIPVAHTQGGEVTGSIDESVRHAITKLAHVHFPATQASRERLIRLGEDPAQIYLTGCPAMDLLVPLEGEPLPKDLFRRYGGVGTEIDPSEPYLLVLQHPVTTEYGSGSAQIRETLLAIHQLDVQTIWFWPNVDAGSDDVSKGIRSFREQVRDSRIHFFINMAPEDYARVLSHAACIVGNSSSALREAAVLGVPAVNIGTRQAGRERGPNVVDVGYSRKEIRAAIEAQRKVGRYPRSTLFGNGNAGRLIAEALATCDPPLQKRITY
jgi:UDP-hydrolysing UDP-N-acetyl-D-glucosamine 2-epimerase